MNRWLLILLLLFGFSQVGYSSEPQQHSVVPEFNNLQQNLSSEKLPYDYTSVEQIPIRLSIIDEVSTKDNIIEGQKLEYRVLEDVYYKDKLILKKGDVVNATLETIVTSGMNGFPAEIIVDNFQIPGVKSSQLQSLYIKKGQNRCFWVYPLKWALTIIPFVGSLTNLIMGGHAKLKTKDIVTLYYFPDWK